MSSLLVVPVGLLVPIDVDAIEAAQVVAIDERPDLTSLAGAGLLIEPEVDAAVDPRVVDVAGDRPERCMERDVRSPGASA